MEVETGAVASITSVSALTDNSGLNRSVPCYKEQMFTCILTLKKRLISCKSTFPCQCSMLMNSLDLLVVEEDGPSLKGCDWLSNLKRNQSVFYAGTEGAIELFHRHADLFKEELVSESG